MQQVKKRFKTDMCPQSQLLLYKSSQLKNPYYVKNKYTITRDNEEDNYHSYKSNFLKISDIKLQQSNKFASDNGYGSMIEESHCGKSSKVKNKKKIVTQPIREVACANSIQHYDIEDLLGINTNRSKKSSQKNYSQQQNNNQYEQMVQLRKQSQQLMRTNEQLLYEKQFYKQKVILQEVEIRDLNRKMKSFSKSSKMHKKKMSYIQQSKNSFKLKDNQTLKMASEVNQSIKMKDSNFGTEKSSMLLLSESSAKEIRTPLCEKSGVDNITMMMGQSKLYAKKIEQQFASLLESIQNQSNQSRKITLRKILAMKAMELKKIKGNQ